MMLVKRLAHYPATTLAGNINISVYKMVEDVGVVMRFQLKKSINGFLTKNVVKQVVVEKHTPIRSLPHVRVLVRLDIKLYYSVI